VLFVAGGGDQKMAAAMAAVIYDAIGC